MTTAAQLTPAERAFAASCGLSPEAFAATRAANRSTRAQTEGQRTEQAAQMAADAIPGMTGQTALHMIRTGTNPHQVQVRKLVTNGVHRTQAEADAAMQRYQEGVAHTPAPAALHSDDRERQAVQTFLRQNPPCWEAPVHELRADERDFIRANGLEAATYRKLRGEFRAANWRPAGYNGPMAA